MDYSPSSKVSVIMEYLKTSQNFIKLKQVLIRYNLLLIFLLFILIGSLVSPQFLTQGNISNLLQQSSLVGIASVGMTFVILTGNIDLSVGSVAAFSGMSVAILISQGMNIWLAVLVSLIAGVIAGSALGGLSAYLLVPSFMTTLAGLVGIRGITYLLSDGTPVSGIPKELSYFGSGRISGVPIVGIIFIFEKNKAKQSFVFTTHFGCFANVLEFLINKFFLKWRFYKKANQIFRFGVHQ